MLSFNSYKNRSTVIFGCIWIWSIFSFSLTCAGAISVSDTSPLTNIHHNKNNDNKRRSSPLATFTPPSSPWLHSQKNRDQSKHDSDEEEEDDRYHGTDILDPALSIAERFPSRGGAAASEKKEAAWVDGLKNSMASALAAAFSKTILAPFDTIKTLQQYHQSTPNVPTLTLVEAVKDIMQRPGGFSNFYAGLGVSVVGAMPSVALYFGTYSYFKKVLSAPQKRADGTTYMLPKTVAVGLAAAMGNTLASFSRVPFEVMKQKLQSNTYRTTLEAVRATLSSWDMIFPKGSIFIQMARDIPYAVVTLVIYEQLQSWSVQRQQQQSSAVQAQQAGSDMVLGAISGGMGSWVTNPLDVIKTRLQTSPAEVYGGSITKCFVETWKEGGGMAFLRGSWPRLMHKIPANGFFFLFYEFFRRVFRCQGYS